ncbi:MAG: 30S ribosomal protein S4 [Sphaerochaetaceae bacterium]|nr:30S ribosomal protein S4 [Sphaerochaetaceae bacterium]
MARYTGPKCRYCRAERCKLFLKGSRCLSAKCPMNNPAECGLPGRDPKARAKKPTDYATMLRAKQKLKRLYCMLEKQFKITFDEASRMPGKTGENLVGLLERRLDNVVFRLHFACSRPQAAQLVGHGHIFVNGKRVDIPSYRVKAGDVISIAPTSKEMAIIKANLEEVSKSGVNPWLSIDTEALKGQFNAVPRREEVKELEGINEQLVVELYSR